MATTAQELLERGVLTAERGRVNEGLALIRAACAAEPGNAEAHAQLARWLLRLHQPDAATIAAEQALAMQPRLAMTLDTIGVVFSHAGKHERAVRCFERALALQPSRANVHFNLASSLKFLGRFDAAEAAYEACIADAAPDDALHAAAREPVFWRAHSALSHLRTQTQGSNHLDRLQRLLALDELTPDAELHLRHALAKELDDLGRHAESFAQLQRGRKRKRATLSYDAARDRALFEAAVRVFDDVLPSAAVSPDDAPIFVVGMPRSGTTLVERILSSHAQVVSVGESPNFGVLLKRASGSPGGLVLDAATLVRSATVNFAALGQQYLAQTRPASSKPRFVDKTPLNFFYLGQIARALPAARIVVLRRDPLDTCLANFRQLFALGVPYYDYSHDLLDTGRYYAQFHRLMAHWQERLPGRLLQLQYESLVTDQRRETASLLEHCHLDWDEACLEFERNPTAVATASAVQVRKSLNASSVGRWRNYAAQLGPLRDLLTAAGIDLTSARGP